VIPSAAIPRFRGLAAVLLTLSALAATAQDAAPARTPTEAELQEEEARAARRAQREALAEAARRIAWQVPDEELKALFEKHVAPPDVATADGRPARLRAFLREVNRRVPQIAASEGYFDAILETRVDGEGEERRLVVSVTPGARTKVTKVVVEFEGDLAGDGAGREEQREQVRAAWTLTEGRPFRQAEWDDAKNRILEKLAERHYAAANLADSVAIVETATATATVKVILDSGPRFTVGALQFEGLKRYDEALVRRYSRMVPGEPFQLERVLELQRALQNSPYFASVVVDIERDVNAPLDVPVKVSFVERAPVDVGLAIGYGTDSGARGEVSYRNRDMFGRAFDMQSALALDRTRQIGYADFFLPPMTFGGPFSDALDTRDSFGALAERTEIQNLRTSRLAFAAYRRFKLGGADYRVGLSYQFERKQPEGADESIARALAPVASATFRWIDSLIDPRKGGVLKVDLAAGARSILSTQDFVQARALYQHWFPLGEDDQVILRGEVGRTIAASRTGIPESFLFRAGGSRSNRGYSYESLGTREGEAIVGGRYLLTGSAEYVHWFSKQWGGALFHDVGDAGDSREDLDRNPSTGVGVRWRTPAGPLAFDVAHAQREKKWRISFTVAIAF